MTTKLLLMAAIVATSGLFLETSEAQAQGYRSYDGGMQNRGISTRVYSPTMNRGYAYPNSSRNYRSYTPNCYSSNYYSPNYYTPSYQTYSSYGYPNTFRYGNGVSFNQGYQYPSSYRYGNYYGNYSGYRQSYPTRFRVGNTGFGYYVR